MGCAREIAKRRDQLSKTTGEAEQNDETAPVSVDDVVRYLRQQDDIVVRQDNGEFLVNARFPMTLADLVVRANRMRERQGKPKFDLPNGVSVLPRQTAPANGHPMFWEQTAPRDLS
jgi:cytidylate kinase